MSRDSSDDKPPAGKDPLGLDDEEADAGAAGSEPGTRREPDRPRQAAGDASGSDGTAPGGGTATPPPAAVTAPRQPRGGRLLAGLALLLALAAAAAAGYVYYELLYRGDVRAVAGRVDTVASRIDEVDSRLEARLGTLRERQQQELATFRESQREARAQTEAALRESLAEVARQAPPATSEWQRAEARYLLRIANHRLLMERDVVGALSLLQAADAVIAELDDFAMHEVRSRLADEIAALQAVEGTDLQGLFLRLEAAKRDLDRLPLREPRFDQAEAATDTGSAPAAQDDAAAVWMQVWERISGLWEFRRLDREARPLLAPEEGVYLELNLRLMLERAQLAALRRDQMIFEQSLDTAIDWIHEYLNADERPVRRLLDELEALRGIDLEQPLPDISGSLQALQQVLRNPA